MTDDIRLIGDGDIRFVDLEASAADSHSGEGRKSRICYESGVLRRETRRDVDEPGNGRTSAGGR